MTDQGRGLETAWYQGAWWLWLLRPLELLFRIIAAARRSLYHCGILKTFRASVPVVVVGNITVGGTGKTPVVIALVEALQASGIRPGVVSRGYGADAGEFPRVLGHDSDAAWCGDEPLLIYRRTGAPCVIGPDRAAAVQALLAHTEVDIVISDDGLQHYALGRDIEIALLDWERGLGNGFCLPAGPLREPASRLETVDYVLYRNGDDAATGVSYNAEAWVNVKSGEQRPLEAFSGQRATALAGIGQPGQFFATVQSLGVNAETCVFADHHRYTAADFINLDDVPILMTEKDAVKCPSLVPGDAWYLRISAQLPEPLIQAVTTLAAH